MKGIVFTEFMEMVEKAHGYEMVDTILEKSNLQSGGIFTAVGTYPHSDMVQLIMNLHKETQTPVADLLQAFGRYLFDTFKVAYPAFFKDFDDSFAFLNSIENYIHIEVLKLYPDAQLPRFESEIVEDKTMRMVYYSERSMAPLAMGLIEKTMEHFNDKALISMENLEEDGSKVLFVITKDLYE